MTLWSAVGAEVVAESGARLATYEKHGELIPGFARQLLAVPRGGRALFVGGWNDHPPTDTGALTEFQTATRDALADVAAVAAERELQVARVLLVEPEAAAATQILEELYAGMLPWPVLRDWPGFYRCLEPLGYWCWRSWQGQWTWKDDHHHRRWTPDAEAALVAKANAVLGAVQGPAAAA